MTDKQIRYLNRLKDRYFRTVTKFPQGAVVHHGHCKIRQPHDIYGWAACTCGLLHDLESLDESLAQKIYPPFQEDSHLEGLAPEPVDSDPLKLWGRVYEAVEMSDEDFAVSESNDWEAVRIVFGEKFAEDRWDEYTPRKPVMYRVAAKK